MRRPGKKLVAFLAVTVGGPLALLAIYFGFIRGDELARTSVVDDPVEISFTVGSDTAIEFWTESEVTPPFAFDTEMSSIASLPHAVDFVIVIEHQGQVLTELVCNPFAVHFFDWESSRSPRDDIWDGRRSRVSYLGRIDECEFTAPANAQLTARVHRRWNDPTWSEYLSQTDLVIRGPGVF